MRVVGPNCLGMVNTDPAVRLNASLAPAVPGRGRVGFFAQSGALGVMLLERASSRGIGLSSFVSAGNRADVSGNDLLQYWATDPATEVVLLHLESFGNPRKFARLARRVGRTKPVVAVKSGRHVGMTAGLAGTSVAVPEQSVAALFASAGVIRVQTLAELFDVGTLLAHQPLPAGGRVAIVGNSTAVGVLVADAVLEQGLSLAHERPVDIGTAAPPGGVPGRAAGRAGRRGRGRGRRGVPAGPGARHRALRPGAAGDLGRGGPSRWSPTSSPPTASPTSWWSAARTACPRAARCRRSPPRSGRSSRWPGWRSTPTGAAVRSARCPSCPTSTRRRRRTSSGRAGRAAGAGSSPTTR